MKIGLTGGTGFIGQYLIRDYGDENEFIAATKRISFEEFQQKARYICVNYDLEGFKKAFIGCDAVVHLGGKVMHGMEYDMNVDAYIENLKLSKDVFEACKELGIKHIINASSVAVYDQIDERPVKEDAACQPNSIYGIMKIAVEKLAELYNRRFGLKIKTLRFAQGLGFQNKMQKGQFWNILLRNSIVKQPIPIYGEGITGRDVIYVKDMTASIITALRFPDHTGCFNIGTGHICTNKEIAEAFCKVFNNTAGIIFLKDREETGIRTCMNCEKAKHEFQFIPQYDVLKLVEDIKLEYDKCLESGKEIIFY